MREIKFRAWQDNQMLTQPKSGVYATASFMDHLYEDTELMQYTGLKDISGREIYEGDIITDDCETKYLIVFIEGCFYGQYDQNDAEGDIDISNKFAPLKVIGNIHENPELLEQ